ncbi:MAG: peptidylprolyl isomerase [Myxococcota bacterium]|nr:peptidylprolyl isomerase [Myxococcota bacterium]
MPPNTFAPRTWWRSPTLHFLSLGALIFGLDHLRRTSNEADTSTNRAINISAEHVGELKRALRVDNPLSAPNDLEDAIKRFVDEEIMVREARAMNLDRGDMIIRRRLVQKMTFLINDMASAEAPSDEEMAQWLKREAIRYEQPERLTISHIYFSRERRGVKAQQDAEKALQATHRGAPIPAGDPFLGGSTLKLRTPKQLERQFGRAFLDGVNAAVRAKRDQDWFGPLRSTFGIHLVRVIERTPPQVATLENARVRIKADMMERRRREVAGRARAALRKKYVVTIEGTP